jgi:glycosyltransferase involved in cell wall biosynthesis
MKPQTGRAACDVVIPARNAEPYIAAAIQSILDQSLAAFHIVIVNDKSTDGTASAAAAFGDRVRIVNGEGKGAGAARNLGVRHSRSDLIAFLDADDVCHPDRLRIQVDALISNPDAAMVFCDAEYTDASGRPTGSLFTCPEYRREAFLGQLFERNRVLTTSVAMVRRSAFDAIGGFDERLSHAEDYDLWLRFAGVGVIEYINQSLILYRLHASNLSGNREALRRCEVEILNKHAVQAIRAALLDTHGNPERADVALSRVLFRMERYNEGETLLRRVCPDESDRALRHFMLGNFAVKRDDVEVAAAEYDLCLAGDPTFAPSHNNLGVIAAAQGRRQQSLEHFIKAAGLRPGYSDPQRNLEALQEGRVSDLRHTLAPLRAVLRPE